MKRNKKKAPVKVYLTKDNINSKLSDKEIKILKESGKYIRCPDYLPED